MIPLGKSAPKFTLKGIDGKTCALEDFKGKKAVAILFLCNHCPYVKATQDRIAKLARELAPQKIQFIGICSNDSEEYPEDAPENLRKQAKEVGFDFPYLVDDTQDVAKAYGAVCTPDIFAFDGGFKLRYRGRIDDSWKDPTKVTRQDLRDALLAISEGREPSSDQLPAMGCSIKWKSTA